MNVAHNRPGQSIRLLIAAVMLTAAAPASLRADAGEGADTTAATQQAASEAMLEQAPSQGAGGLDNPISILSNASQLLDGFARLPQAGAEGERGEAGQAPPLGGEDGAGPIEQTGLSTTLSIIMILTVLTIAPSLLILCTSFVRVAIVLALLRQALGTQQLPPSQVIIGLSLFVTMLVMAPTFERINEEAIVPLTENEITELEAWQRTKQPLREFMLAQIAYADNWGDIYMILNYRGVDTSDPAKLTEDDIDMLTLIPAYILSELKIAFLMGFKLYLPFLVIDMVIASVLISMGMMMLPPVLISLPFKLLLFVLVDGWRLVVGNLLNSFATMPAETAAATMDGARMAAAMAAG